MENHLDFIVIKAEPKFRADSFVLDEADCSAAPVETGIVPVTLSLYACDKRDTAARRAWDNFGVVTEMVPLGLLSGCLLLPQAYEDADALIDDCLYLDQPLGEMVDQLTAHGYDCENTFIITDVLLTPPRTIRMYWMPSWPACPKRSFSRITFIRKCLPISRRITATR